MDTTIGYIQDAVASWTDRLISTWMFPVIHFLQGSEVAINLRLFMLKSNLSARVFQIRMN